MTAYDKPPELYDGLRLHQNENTAGCSPRALDALAALRPDEVGFYPPYAAATRACAQYLGVEPDQLALTNGLDEGIMGLAVAYLRPSVGGPIPEAVVQAATTRATSHQIGLRLPSGAVLIGRRNAAPRSASASGPTRAMPRTTSRAFAQPGSPAGEVGGGR